MQIDGKCYKYFSSYHALLVIIPTCYFCKMCSVEFSLIIRKISSFAKPSTAQPFDSICQLQKANETRKSSLRLNSLVMPHSRIKNAKKNALHSFQHYTLIRHTSNIGYHIQIHQRLERKLFMIPRVCTNRWIAENTRLLDALPKITQQNLANTISFSSQLSLNIFSCIRILNYQVTFGDNQ